MHDVWYRPAYTWIMKYGRTRYIFYVNICSELRTVKKCTEIRRIIFRIFYFSVCLAMFALCVVLFLSKATRYLNNLHLKGSQSNDK